MDIKIKFRVLIHPGDLGRIFNKVHNIVCHRRSMHDSYMDTSIQYILLRGDKIYHQPFFILTYFEVNIKICYK